MNDRPRQGGRPDSRGSTRPAPPPISADEIQKILQRGAEEIDRNARDVAQRCADLSPTQIRNFYGPIVRLRSDVARIQTPQVRAEHARALYMHSARLAYMAARDSRATSLHKCFEQMVRAAVKNNQADNGVVAAICDFAEALVAYHTQSSKNKESRR